MAIIYKATCTKNGKAYVGFTTKPLSERKREHINSKSLCVFHKAIRKHGRDSFVWEILLESDDAQYVKSQETPLTIQHNTHYKDGCGYNMCYGDNPLPNQLGKKLSQKTRFKMSEASRAENLSPETRKKISNACKGEKNGFYGRKHTPKTIEKLRQLSKKQMEFNHPCAFTYILKDPKGIIHKVKKGKQMIDFCLEHDISFATIQDLIQNKKQTASKGKFVNWTIVDVLKPPLL